MSLIDCRGFREGKLHERVDAWWGMYDEIAETISVDMVKDTCNRVIGTKSVIIDMQPARWGFGCGV